MKPAKRAKWVPKNACLVKKTFRSSWSSENLKNFHPVFTGIIFSQEILIANNHFANHEKQLLKFLEFSMMVLCIFPWKKWSPFLFRQTPGASTFQVDPFKTGAGIRARPDPVAVSVSRTPRRQPCERPRSSAGLTDDVPRALATSIMWFLVFG